jgi:PilZ domain
VLSPGKTGRWMAEPPGAPLEDVHGWLHALLRRLGSNLAKWHTRFTLPEVILIFFPFAPSREMGEYMGLEERRLMPRKQIRIPLRFRVLPDGPVSLRTGESRNSSERGVYFLTDSPLAVGSKLELLLPIGSDSAGRAARELRCTARVVHCDPHAGPNQKAGVGVFIERFESPAQ